MYKKKFPQQNYIYTSSKPQMNSGDSSLESESFNDIEEEDEKIITENCLEMSKESELPPIHIPFSNKNREPFPQYKQGLFFGSATKDTDNEGIKANYNNKDDIFSMKKVINIDKENNRYSNNSYINYLYNQNCRFFNIFQAEDKGEKEDEYIDNNEMTINFVNELNEHYNYKKDNQFEVLLLDNNNSKIDINSEISDNHCCNNNYLRIDKDKIYEIKNENLIKKNKINENVKRIIQKINKNKTEWNNKNMSNKKQNIINIKNKDNNGDDYFIENKENYIRNGQYDTEVKFNFTPIKDNSNKKSKIIEIKKKENSSINLSSNKNIINKNLNSKYFERKNNKISIDMFISKSRSSKNFSLKRKRVRNILYLTKKYKIFHKFLCVSLDTSGLYTLDDDMNSLLLHPKITYNYPFNNSENELE